MTRPPHRKNTSPYANRIKDFAGHLSYAADRLTPQFDRRDDFAARVELAARDMDVHGLSAKDWRTVVGAVTERAWRNYTQPALVSAARDERFSPRGYRALVARDVCGCGHERRDHYDRGGSTVGCWSCGCKAYALAGESAARPRAVVHA